MTLDEVKKILDAEVIPGSDLRGIRVTMGCGADLMSDVLAHIKAGSLLLTGLTNPQVVRTAEMASVEAICFVRGKRPPDETIRLAASRSIPLMVTRLPMFESCGLLYKEGMIGCSERD
jgi:predicted transcriptional regulator